MTVRGRPPVVTVLFWIAFGVCVAAALASLSDVRAGRSDAAGRGLASAFAWLVLPFPIVALVLFLLSRSSALRVTAAVLAAAPLLAVLVLTLAKGAGERVAKESSRARRVFRGGGAAALGEAVEEGRLEKIRGLVAQGVDVDSAGRDGTTPLWFALSRSQTEAALLLVQLGADPARGPEGEPKALTVAAQSPAFVDVLRAMLAAGTSPDTTDDVIGRPTPLLFLAMNTNARPNIRAVVEAGARLDVVDLNGRTPLARAILWRMWDEALLMVERGAPVSPGQSGPANLEAALSENVPLDPDPGELAAWRRLLESLAAKGLPVPPPEPRHLPADGG